MWVLGQSERADAGSWPIRKYRCGCLANQEERMRGVRSLAKGVPEYVSKSTGYTQICRFPLILPYLVYYFVHMKSCSTSLPYPCIAYRELEAMLKEARSECDALKARERALAEVRWSHDHVILCSSPSFPAVVYSNLTLTLTLTN